MKERIFKIVEKAEDGDITSKIFDNVILILIVMTVISIILESFESLSIVYSKQFYVFEVFSVIVFTVEYLLRLWTSDLKYSEKSKLKARILYILSFMALVDLFAILPFYLPMIIPFDLRFLRIMRLTRIFRIFKLNRYSSALNLIAKVLREKKEELLATITMMILIILFSSTLIYYAEHEVQPDKFPNIVASFWWAVATLTTVGYGDIYPITGLGKILSSIIAVTGIGLVALPTGIISSGFMEEISVNRTTKCPHCGQEHEI